jgi:uncharacterized membrane protein YgcG
MQRASIRFLAAQLLVCALLLFGHGAQADERILNFDSTVETSRDGTLRVTEVITVNAESREIKRGIYRDIPLLLEDENGSVFRAGFELIKVLRDGVPEPHKVNGGGSGVRIYFGDKDVYLTPGTYTYTLVYDTTRQIRFFEDADEVYWNATGNEWAFPIDRATATIVLPDGAEATRWTAYTGGYGEDGADFTERSEDGGQRVVFETTRPLGPGEGLTVAVEIPKGVIIPPTEAEKARFFLADHRGGLIAGFGLLILAGYYLYHWQRVGRDPPAGVIFPRFHGPEGVSPALANYISNRGLSGGGWTAMSAACLSLAVKGHLKLEDLDGDVSLVKVEAGSGPAPELDTLPAGEASILNWLGARDEQKFKLSKSNGKSVSKLGSAFRSAVLDEGKERYFKHNRIYVLPGILISILVVACLIIFGGLTEDEMFLTIPMLMISIFMTVLVILLGQVAFGGGSRGPRIFAGLGLAAVLGGGLALCWLIMSAMGVGISPFPVAVVALIATNILFFFLLGAPTVHGQQVLDEIEGLKLYLTVAEKDRMNMQGAPQMSPAHFETLLPYAVALQVEKPWSEAFQAWLLSAAGAAAASDYSPQWHSGRSFDRSNVMGSLSNTTGDMASTFVSSLPVAKSSSSGSSGGSSGGGGGGGGGGGW